MRRLTILLAALAALMLVPAASAFGAEENTLKVTLAGSGEGTVTSGEGSPSIKCRWNGTEVVEYETGVPSVCEQTMIEFFGKDIVQLVVEEVEEGSEFTGWEVTEGTAFGGCTGVEIECKVETPPGSNAKVTATFESTGGPTQPLTTKINQGEGTVISNPAGIECTGAAPTVCEEEFPEGEEVTLTASPAAGYRFYNWPSCPGTANGRQCTVTMSAAKEVKVNFKKSWQLTASKATGSQPGIVKVLPTGVTCPYKCQSSSYEFLDGQEVTVDRYEPNGQLHFTEFTGGTGSAAACNGATTPCSFTLEADSSIEALFEANAQATLSLQKEGGGQAKITSSPAGIYCFNTCSQASSEFYSEPSAEEVTLSWTLGNGTSSLEWSTGAGTCTGSSSSNGSCKVTMSEAHELVATLE